MNSELTFFVKLRELNETLARNSGAPSTIFELRSLLEDPDVRREFFKSLDRADWIVPLREAAFFENPTPSILEEGVGVSNLQWPPSKYLARMATSAPSEVAAIFASLNTDNVSIIGDMLKAALAMPANIAATLVPAISRAARAGQLWLVEFTEAAALCMYLANGGEVSSGMSLANALFEPKLENGKDRPHGMDDYWYEKELEKLVPVFIKLRPREFLLKLCNWLKANSNARSDYSYIWRPAIEEHAQNSKYDRSGALVGFVRDGCEHAVRDGLITLDESLEILDQFHFVIFKRIRLHLINEFAERKPELAQRAIMDRSLFDAREYKHEYAMLVGRHFKLLAPSDRETWFGWIDAGPDRSYLDNSSDELRQDHLRYWQFQKLHCVREHLEGERKEFYYEMFTNHGEPKLADLNSYHESGWGFISPMTIEELTKLSFPDVIDRVSSWRPSGDGFREPEIEGLASTFERYLATNPEGFSAQAKLLIDRPAIFVRTFLERMADAVKTGREIDLNSVLDLCDWVLTQPTSEQSTPLQEHSSLADKDWQWTRDQIAEFVKGLCNASVNERPKFSVESYWKRFWSLIRPLCHDEPTSYIVRDVSQDDPRIRDYLDLAINSPRGKALDAALAYARWVGNQLKKLSGEREIIPGGFDAMPDVREMLEWQIEPNNRSIHALAVIGTHINLIYWIDKNWLAANAAQLFQLEGDLRSLSVASGWAAWNAFLTWVPPHIEFYKLFKEQYAFAVAQSSHIDLTAQTREQPMFHLGDHLMLLYGRGHFGLDGDQGLLRRFLTETNPDIRRHAIGFVGRSLTGNEKAPAEVVSRFMAVWEIYWSGPGRKDAEERPDTSLFGGWFSSGQFPEKWALEQLDDFVRVVPTPQPDHEVGKRLAEICDADIATAVRILDQMIRGDREGWRVYGWRDPAKVILKKAMAAGGGTAIQAAQTIDYLGRHGFSEFGELLDVGR